MTEKRQISKKALSAYLKSRHTSLSASVARIGMDQECIDGDTIDVNIFGRIARLLGLSPEQLAVLVEAHATP